MNLEHTFTSQDTPKMAVIGLLLLTLLFSARFMAGRVSAQREQARTIAHMNLEMGRGPNADTSEVPEVPPGHGDPNFVW